jgi:hypothetical protein
VKSDAGELRHLWFVLSQYLLKFLGAELTSICAAEYAIVVIILHTFSFPRFVFFMVTPEVRWKLDNDKPMRTNPVSNWHQISLDIACLLEVVTAICHR